jgi:hypothetical protein
MKVSIDNYANGARPEGEPTTEQLTEVQAADGSCWAHVVIPEGETATASIRRAEDAEPEAIEVRMNAAWEGPAVETEGAVSARPGWPRLVLALASLPDEG